MNILDEFDTITAVSTPFGTGGVGVIRVSGSKAFDILNKIFKGKTLVSDFKPSHFYHGVINDGKNVIDEVIILPFFAPNSYTGENVFEVQCHGGINVVNSILDLILKQGARLAEKGEFTKRAFLNKKLDLDIFSEDEERQRAEKNNKLGQKILSILKDVDINRMTPMESFEVLNDLVNSAKGE